MTYEEQSKWNVAGRVGWEERIAPSGVVRGDSRYLIKTQLFCSLGNGDLVAAGVCSSELGKGTIGVKSWERDQRHHAW